MEDAGPSFFTRFQMEFLPPAVRQASFNDKPLFVILVSAYLRCSRMIFFSLRFSEQVHPALSPVSFLHLKCLVDDPHFRFSINTSQTFADNPFPSRDVNPSWNRWNDLFPTISYQSQNADTVWGILPGNRRNFPSSGRHPGREFRISLKTYTFSPATSRIINIC